MRLRAESNPSTSFTVWEGCPTRQRQRHNPQLSSIVTICGAVRRCQFNSLQGWCRHWSPAELTMHCNSLSSSGLAAATLRPLKRIMNVAVAVACGDCSTTVTNAACTTEQYLTIQLVPRLTPESFTAIFVLTPNRSPAV